MLESLPWATQCSQRHSYATPDFRGNYGP